MNKLLEMLSGGDRRSIGRSNEVVTAVLADSNRFGEVFEGLLAEDPVLRMRAADAVEKITARRPELLQPFKNVFFQQVAPIEQQEVRWHAAQMIPRLRMDEVERQEAVGLLSSYLLDKSSIVKTFAMQALADLAEQDGHLRPKVIEILSDLTLRGTPAMRSRGKKLLDKLNRSG